MAQSPSRLSELDANAPSLDPAAIEQAYLRERARRRARSAQRTATRNSHGRFWVALALLILLTVVVALTAWREIQTTFGV
jgi:hypothetical protein